MRKHVTCFHLLPATTHHPFAYLQALVLGNNCFDVLVQAALGRIGIFAEYILDLDAATLEFLLYDELLGEATSETIYLTYNYNINLMSVC